MPTNSYVLGNIEIER